MSRLTAFHIGLAALVFLGLGLDPADLTGRSGLFAMLQVADWLTLAGLCLALFRGVLGPMLPPGVAFSCPFGDRHGRIPPIRLELVP